MRANGDVSTLEATVRVPMNIALVKYWGKRDEQLIIPLNDSISLTVDRLRAETTVRMIQGAGEHAVISTTNFPVAAGLASSAAGFAAIALAIQRILNLDDVQANRLARIGSGSACRSMFGGLVQWEKGEKADGSDCVAKRIGTETWPDLYCVILVFDDGRKKVGSSEGMRRTAQTSTLLQSRIEKVVPQRIEEIKTAFAAKDFAALARVIMADSNQFHAVCLDTSPPIRYLNDASWHLIELVEKFNENEIRAAYTFDAGPNACVLLEATSDVEELSDLADIIRPLTACGGDRSLSYLQCVHENQAKRMKSRSEWFLSPVSSAKKTSSKSVDYFGAVVGPEAPEAPVKATRAPLKASSKSNISQASGAEENVTRRRSLKMQMRAAAFAANPSHSLDYQDVGSSRRLRSHTSVEDDTWLSDVTQHDEIPKKRRSLKKKSSTQF
uniref:Diphosphomevalonate decarboxylase n=1 Tax=Caenorhabditis japonica TaxID=281687 RepID=A0A8R1DN98_CAEJA